MRIVPDDTAFPFLSYSLTGVQQFSGACLLCDSIVALMVKGMCPCLFLCFKFSSMFFFLIWKILVDITTQTKVVWSPRSFLEVQRCSESIKFENHCGGGEGVRETDLKDNPCEMAFSEP